jgi:allantoin racemase
MTTHVRIVSPITADRSAKWRRLQTLAGPGVRLSVAQIAVGPASIESEFEDALAVPATIAKVIEAEREGADAVVIDCLCDPGLRPCRAVASIPVLGPAQAAMSLAAMFGQRFGVVTVVPGLGPTFENLAAVYGFGGRLASVRAVDIPVLELERDPERTRRALVAEAAAAVERDRAHAIVFGCSGMFGMAAAVIAGLAERGHPGVPVIDPLPAAVELAVVAARLGISQSRLTYARPPRGKPLTGYGFLPELAEVAGEPAPAGAP